MSMYSTGVQSGVVVAGTVLADTGVINAGAASSIQPDIWISANVAAEVELQVRNAANNATVASHTFWVGATAPVTLPPSTRGILANAGERVRLVLTAATVGSVQGTINL